ncbi:His-Xaa-Ser repeat protein HxsA2 [Ralstonia mannitolilytica]|nr:His-Xaa-Ser repeat protein HxsA2 [Ralstonia mannitolilytica]QIF06253.1 hypothetical protein G5A69_00020 [Ralstonia mannitolilytica]
MKSFAAVASGFAAHAATAAQVPQANVEPATTAAVPQATQPSEQIAVHTSQGDAFKFVLRRSTKDNKLMAWHSSHASHASHASHRSHYSGY